MPVILPAPPDSRAGSLPLIGGVLALDFANTESGRGFPTHRDHLPEARHVADWLEHAGALAPEDADRLRVEAAARPEFAAELLARTRAELPVLAGLGERLQAVYGSGRRSPGAGSRGCRLRTAQLAVERPAARIRRTASAATGDISGSSR